MQTRDLYQRLKEFEPQTFQKLCFHLVKARHPGLQLHEVDDSSGDEGIDFFSGPLPEGLWIWQCKNFRNTVGKSQKAQIRDSLNTALNNFKPRSWVLCIPINMDPKTTRWFEKLKKSKKAEVSIGLLDASNIVHWLLHYRKIREEFFPGTNLTPAEIEKLLQKNSELTNEEISLLATKSNEQFVDRLLTKDPRFSYQVTYFDDYLPKGPPGDISIANSPGVIMSIWEKNRKIDVFPRDLEALAANPPTIKMTLKGDGAEKFLRNIRTGTTEKIEGGDIVNVETSLPQIMETDFSQGSLTVSSHPPSKHTGFVKAEFSLGTRSRVYPLVKFQLVRHGTEEMEISSQNEDLPFVMSFILKSTEPPIFNFKSRWTGASVRAIKECYEALQILSEGGILILTDVANNLQLGKAGPKTGRKIEYDINHKKAIFDLVEILDAFNLNLIYPPNIKDEDLSTISFLKTILAKGRVIYPAGSAWSINLQRSSEQARAVGAKLSEEGTLLLELDKLIPELTLFGTPIEIGPCQYYCPHIKYLEFEKFLHDYRTLPENNVIPVSIMPLEPIQLIFPNITNKKNSD